MRSRTTSSGTAASAAPRPPRPHPSHIAPTAAPPPNYWPDTRCARAFWRQQELPPYRQLLADTTARLLIEGAVLHLQADLDWLERCLEELV